MSNEALRKQWSATAKKALVGRKIVKAHYPSATEIQRADLPGSGVLLTLDDGSVWMPFRDDEGNDAGALVMVKAVMTAADFEAAPKHLPTL